MTSRPLYKKDSCVLILSGRGWPDDNGRPGRQQPEYFGANSIGYLDRPGPNPSRIYFVGKQRVYWVANEDYQPFDPTTTGVRTPNKICLSCARLKPLEEYASNQNNRAGQRTTRPRCKDCYSAESGPNLTKRAKDDFKREVGAPEQGDMWRCPVCRKVSIADVNAEVRVDHDQERRRPRGLICDSCNTGLGRFKNGEDHLRDAIAYLRAYEEGLEQE
jgi:hypothetical protein